MLQQQRELSSEPEREFWAHMVFKKNSNLAKININFCITNGMTGIHWWGEQLMWYVVKDRCFASFA